LNVVDSIIQFSFFDKSWRIPRRSLRLIFCLQKDFLMI